MTFDSAVHQPEPDERDEESPALSVAQQSAECSAAAQAPRLARRPSQESVWSPPAGAGRSWPFRHIRGSSSEPDRACACDALTLRLAPERSQRFELVDSSTPIPFWSG